jgi:hypothetical protein
MLLLKSCDHCLGDMYLEEFLGDRELVCLQCGNRVGASTMTLAPVRVGADVRGAVLPSARKDHWR